VESDRELAARLAEMSESKVRAKPEYALAVYTQLSRAIEKELRKHSPPPTEKAKPAGEGGKPQPNGPPQLMLLKNKGKG